MNFMYIGIMVDTGLEFYSAPSAPMGVTEVKVPDKIFI